MLWRNFLILKLPRAILFANKIKTYLGQFGGVWITPDPSLSAERRNRLGLFSTAFRDSAKKVEQLAGQKYDDHGFVSERAADMFFESGGFVIEKLTQPTKLVTASIDSESENQQRIVEDIRQWGRVWVLSLPQK